MSVLLIEGDQTSQLPLPYLSVTKHLLTPSINHCSHLQCSHCSQSRNNCSSRSNPFLSIFQIPTFQADHSQQINSLFQPISSKAIFVIGKIFSRFTFLTLYADCSCVPARSFVSRFLLSFTPDTFRSVCSPVNTLNTNTPL